MSSVTRRSFLKLGGAAIAGAGLANWPQASMASGQSFSGYKALVNIFLLGGNDGFNMVVPRSDFEYNEYAASRQNLAIAKADLLPVNPLSAGTAQYGFHPQLAEAQQLFQTGKLAVMANTGNLAIPATKASLQDPNTARPRQLFSHNDQQDQWRYANPTSTKTGWGGRLGELLHGQNTNSLLTNVAIGGRSNWLASQNHLDLSIQRNGFDRYDYVRPDKNWAQNRRQAFQSLLQQSYQNPFAQEFAESQQRTMELVEQVGGLVAGLPDFNTPLPVSQNRLAESLRMVARLIAIREQLGMQRQVFYVAMGGFDTHDDQLQRQPVLLQQLSQALGYFYDLTQELGVAESVTSFTSSEFGRTLTSNGDGTDHAWGNHHLVMGAGVKGGDIYGTMPSLEIGGVDDYRNDGRIIPTTSVEQYAKPLLDWFGTDEQQTMSVLPNLSAFAMNKVNFML